MNPIPRRDFVRRSCAVLPAAWLVASTAGGETETTPARRQPIRLGAPVFQAPADPEELALAHRQLGYGAAYCPAVGLDDPGRIRALRAAFAKHEVVIAEVGRWVNLLEADSDKRRANLKYVTEGLALADEIGARCCVDIAGSFNSDVWYGPHQDNLSRRFFDAAVENARKIIDAVQPRRAKFGYEMMGWALPDSPDSCLELIRAVDRPGFAVHLDPCNLVNSPARFYGNAALISECFDKLGRWIVSCHAKDLAWEIEMNVHFREVRPGLGAIDYGVYLQHLARLPQQPPLMLEHLDTAEAYAAGADYIRRTGREDGLSFA